MIHTRTLRHQSKGFTIVELLIVIVVIGILAAITIVAFNGVQNRANNMARISELRDWQKLFEMYKAENGEYPDMPKTGDGQPGDGGYCLGTGFPIGGSGVPRCRDYTGTDIAPTALRQSNSTPLMDELKKVGALPSGLRKPVTNTVGPYVYYQSNNHIKLIAVMNGKSASDCPAGTTSDWTDNQSKVMCHILLRRP